MQKYGSKRDKALAAKGWAIRESLSVWETEWLMDVKLFLEGQAKWEMDSPYHCVMIHEMFQHASEQGPKEAERMVCWGCQHELSKLDPEADMSAIQLVGPQTSRKEIKPLYYEVYKLQRPPGSPPREPELMAEVVSSLEDCQGREHREVPQMSGEPNSIDVWLPRSRTPRRKDALRERSLTEVREAHHRALVMAAALEEEIEWLSHTLVWSWVETQTQSCSRDCHRPRSRGQKRRCCQGWSEDCHAPYFEYQPSQRNSEPRGGAVATEDLNLEEPPELGPEVTCFLQGSAESLEEENMKVPSSEPPIEELQNLVTWKAQAYKTPGWWQELTMVPGVDDYGKLACEVWASFWLLKRASELCQVKNDHQALPALLCLHWETLLPLPDSIFACWDIWEIQQDKTLAYTWALQFWAEKADPPTGGRPCQLVGSIKELWEEMRCYLSFSDKDVFKGIGLPQETSIPPTEDPAPQSAKSIPTGTPVEEATMEMAMEPDAEKRPPNKFPGWEKVLHPSRPMVATGADSPSVKRPKTKAS